VVDVSILHYDRRDPDRVIEAVIGEFEQGTPVVLPTETLYGMGAPISNKDAIENIFTIKERPQVQTLPVAVGDLHMIDDIAIIKKWQKSSLRDNLPGPVTFVLGAKNSSDPLVIKNGTIAVRVPHHPLFFPLCSNVGPLGLTSANIHGGTELQTANEINDLFNDQLLIIEDDASIGGSGSSIIDLTREIPTVLREGNLNIDEFMGENHGRG
jgi:L-threonylcarbamoyladenylate synthase